jgi:hypothetical protein
LQGLGGDAQRLQSHDRQKRLDVIYLHSLFAY